MVDFERIEKGLTDSNVDTRINTLKNFKEHLSVKQIERGLTDVNVDIRLAFYVQLASRLTIAQIERGLLDFSHSPPRESLIPSFLLSCEEVFLTMEQIERALSCKGPTPDSTVAELIRIAAAARICKKDSTITPTEAQIKRGLKDSLWVREVFVKYQGFRPSKQVLDTLLQDSSPIIRRAAYQKQAQLENEALKAKHSKILAVSQIGCAL